MTTEKGIFIIADYETSQALTLNELCEILNLNRESITEYIENEIIHPVGDSPRNWNFDINELKRLRRALRLQRDLHVNIEGIAVLLTLLEEVDEMRAQLQLLEKHYTHHE